MPKDPQFRLGDVINIPCDQYGQPVHRFDSVTMKPTQELQQFVITSVGTMTGTISLSLPKTQKR